MLLFYACSAEQSDAPPLLVPGSIAVLPDSVTLPAAGRQQFAVSRLDDDGTGDDAVRWTATGGGIDPEGVYTAGPAGGRFGVVASTLDGTLADSASIVIVAGDAPLPPPVSVASCPGAGYARLVAVDSPSRLDAAVSAAEPGDQIRLAPGTYGRVRITRSGAADRPITLCGPRTAVLDGGTTLSGYVLHLDGASYWRVLGISVTNGQKGVMLDSAHGNLLEGIEVHHVGSEAVHFRSSSTRDTIRNSHIHHAGQVGDAHYGEGIYIGSSVNNALNDASNDIVVLGNLIEDVTAEAIDIKEGSRGAVVRGNTIRRTGSGNRSAAAAIGTRAGNGVFELNTVIPGESLNGFQVYSGGGSGDGDNNVFRANSITISSTSANGFSIAPSQTGNVIHCDNVVAVAGSRLTNLECSP